MQVSCALHQEDYPRNQTAQGSIHAYTPAVCASRGMKNVCTPMGRKRDSLAQCSTSAVSALKSTNSRRARRYESKFDDGFCNMNCVLVVSSSWRDMWVVEDHVRKRDSEDTRTSYAHANVDAQQAPTRRKKHCVHPHHHQPTTTCL